MKFFIILLIAAVFSSDHCVRYVAAQCDVYNYGYEYPIVLPLQLGTVFHRCIAHLVESVTKLSNGFLVFIITPERLLPVQPLFQKWESLPNPNFVNVIDAAVCLVGFNLQPLLEIIPTAISNTPIDVDSLIEYLLSSLPPGTQTITFGLGVQLVGSYTSQYFIQRITDLLNSLPALPSYSL